VLQGWVEQGQKAGLLDAKLPADVVLFSYYARTCDPAIDFLQKFSKMRDDDIVGHMLSVAFEGLRGA
jgi:hypothetical protein